MLKLPIRYVIAPLIITAIKSLSQYMNMYYNFRPECQQATGYSILYNGDEQYYSKSLEDLKYEVYDDYLY